MPPLNPQEKNWVRERLKPAEHDLRAAELMRQDAALTYGYLGAFVCQQATEEIVKAALLTHGVTFPRSHDISRRLVLLPGSHLFLQTEFDDAARISDCAVEVRYPGGKIVPADLRKALRIARHFHQRLLPEIQAALS